MTDVENSVGSAADPTGENPGNPFHPLKFDKNISDSLREEGLVNRLTSQDYPTDSYIISKNFFEDISYFSFSYYEKFFHIKRSLLPKFKSDFSHYIKGDKFVYDNLVNLLIMVKNGGDSFRKVLETNLPFIDRWTFLDTGSTDNTLNIIREVMSKKEGVLYTEPFINFRESRNRLLELVGQSCPGDCVYNIMLDDTYCLVDGKQLHLRDFLHLSRSSPEAISLSLYIREGDILYSSNRITRPSAGLRYKYRVHEIIETNVNYLIPETCGYITGLVTNSMLGRTTDRKLQDLKFLLEDYSEAPDSRLAYYIAETYLFLKDFVSAIRWYEKRTEYAGYEEEYYDSVYKIAVLSDTHEGVITPTERWSISERNYVKCYELDPKRPEPLFMLGSHYKNSGNFNTAFLYIKKAWELGSPEKKGYNMNLKHEMYNIHIPSSLLELCLSLKEFETGMAVAQTAGSVSNSSFYYEIFRTLIEAKKWRTLSGSTGTADPTRTGTAELRKKKIDDRKVIVFVTRGGWDKWDGETLYSKGLGGSETTMIRYAECLSLKYRVLFFCPCVSIKTFNNVEYFPIESYIECANVYHFDLALVNRYSEYLNVTVDSGVPCYFMVHDLFRQGEIISNNPLMKGVLCPTEWCAQYAKGVFPTLAHKISTFSYGVAPLEEDVLSVPKNPYSFIYPSFPNRGLSVLLKMWPRILTKYPYAKLDIFCDFENEWVKTNHGEEMKTIIPLLKLYSASVTNHGWVNKKQLELFWKKSTVWLYPCKFLETACLTCMEAMLFKNLVICPNLAGLADTAKHCVTVSGDPTMDEWQNKAFDVLSQFLDNPEILANKVALQYNKILEKSYTKVVEEFEKKYIL